MAAFGDIAKPAAAVGTILWIIHNAISHAFSAVTPLFQMIELFTAAAVLVCFGAATPKFVSYMRPCDTKTRFWRAAKFIAFGLIAGVAVGHVLYCSVWALDQTSFVGLDPFDKPSYAAWRLFLFSWNNTSRLGTGVGWLLPLSHTARIITSIHDVFIVMVVILGVGSLAGQMFGIGCPARTKCDQKK